MALTVVTMVELRLEVLFQAERSGESVTEVCRRHGISRQTYYRYRRRYLAEGLEGLEDRSREPIHQPARSDADLECRVRWTARTWVGRPERYLSKVVVSLLSSRTRQDTARARS
jgi:hypothetical protein